MAVDLVLERCRPRASLRMRGVAFALFQSTGAPSGADTQMGGEVDDMDAAMEELPARGVVFEEDAPELT